LVGAKLERQDHLPGCAASPVDDGRTSGDDSEQGALSSPISMKASPRSVESVLVGEAGDCGIFSSRKVSSVIVRDGAICAG
jgi:hypothetical protein